MSAMEYPNPGHLSGRANVHETREWLTAWLLYITAGTATPAMIANFLANTPGDARALRDRSNNASLQALGSPLGEDLENFLARRLNNHGYFILMNLSAFFVAVLVVFIALADPPDNKNDYRPSCRTVLTVFLCPYALVLGLWWYLSN